MGQVSVTLNGRTYTMRCAEGEEPHLIELANYVKQRVDVLAQEFGEVGDDRVLLMAAMLIADELMLARGNMPARPPPAAAMNGFSRAPPPLPPGEPPLQAQAPQAVGLGKLSGR
jgi:cell division protein ZapA